MEYCLVCDKPLVVAPGQIVYFHKACRAKGKSNDYEPILKSSQMSKEQKDRYGTQIRH